MSDIGPVKKIVASDLRHVLQRIRTGFGQRRSLANDEEHTAARRQNTAAVGLRAHMVHSASDPVESLDLVSLLIGAGIALRRQYDAQRREIMPFEPRIRSVGHGAEDIDDIALQARQHDLGFGIAETGVELDHLDPLRSLHQTAAHPPP